MARKNPPPVPPLKSLADTPAKQRDIQELHMFLFLLWNSLGGADDPLEDLQNGIPSIGLLQAVTDQLARKLEQISLLSDRLTLIEHQVQQLSRALPQEFTEHAELHALRQKIKDLELQ